MSRPPSAPGETGKITLTPRGAGYRVRARMRLPDLERRNEVTGEWAPGRRVDVYAVVRDPKNAQKAIDRAARERLRRHHEEARRNDASAITVSEAAASMLKAMDEGGDGTEQTRYLYRRAHARYIEGTEVGGKSVAEVTAADLRALLARIARKVGVPTARTTRAVLGRTFIWVQDSGIRADSPAVHLKIETKGAKKRASKLDHGRAFTDEEAIRLISFAVRDRRSRERDLADIIVACFVVGGRIGEILAPRWSDIHEISRDGGRWPIEATVKRVIGKGLVAGETKTRTSEREIPIGPRFARLLMRRRTRAGVEWDSTDPIFPTPGRKTFREVGAVGKDLRKLLDRAGFEWASSHAFRRSAITKVIDKVSIRKAADFAGHASPRTTVSDYMARGVVDVSVEDLW